MHRGRRAAKPWWRRASAAAGLAGPALFTLAWAVNGQRQSAYPIADEHISGLAAVDADHPTSMIAGFVVLGAATIAFSAELRRVLGGRRAGWGPVLLGLGGAAAVAAGLLRRDAVLLHPPGRAGDYVQSWHNNGHDVAAGVIYVSTVVAPLLLAWRFRKDPQWSGLVPVAVASSVAGVVLMTIFATDVDRHGNGIVQRVMVTLPQLFMAGLAVRLVTARDPAPPSSSPTGPARRGRR
ncbi:MAG TPA: DUF998 domain-containing protein [Acidimicrobiales bacterium]|nr:DUF998 domain-containing protein [Acidimicrobiales bacterium]